MLKISSNCIIRKYIRYFTLSSGKIAMFTLFLDWKQGGVSCYACAACVAKTKKEARKWLEGKSKKLDNKITGDGNLEAFIFFKHCIEEVNSLLETLNTNSMVCIQGTDERRHHAYGYVKRYGYEEICDNGGTYYCKYFFKK